MAALSASKFNPVLSLFYKRMIQHAKEKKVALTACMRKLLTFLNAIIRDQQRWNPSLKHFTYTKLAIDLSSPSSIINK